MYAPAECGFNRADHQAIIAMLFYVSKLRQMLLQYKRKLITGAPHRRRSAKSGLESGQAVRFAANRTHIWI